MSARLSAVVYSTKTGMIRCTYQVPDRATMDAQHLREDEALHEVPNDHPVLGGDKDLRYKIDLQTQAIMKE